MGFTVEENRKDDVVCTYAALILQDDNVPITAENINKLLSASGNKVEAFWPGLVAGLLEGQDVKALLLAGGGGDAGAAGGDAGGAAAAPEPEEEEEDEEEECDMGFSLFDQFRRSEEKQNKCKHLFNSCEC